MDKVILKKFAIESRQDLMDKIRNKIKTFYIDEDFNSEQKGEVYVLSNEKHSLSLTNDEFKKRELLIKRVRELSLEQVIEEAAYTWFNRIIAIRYMEINDMLPLTKDNQSLGIRVLSSKDNTPDPEILKFTNLVNQDLDIDFKKEKYAELENDNEKFKYVLLLVCKKLGRVIPQVFDGITDYIDILIPDNLLNDTGFITKVINEVPESNYNQVEIIGWLYQYYNQLEKDRVITAKKAYKKQEIPYATQLFTPDWIVKYMVENTLGKYWIEQGGSEELISNWKYYIPNELEIKNTQVNIEDIKFIDPCCGSGHIIIYAFELFFQMYSKLGYNKNNIAELILKNNLFGLDIDDRAGQLSILSILLKAREYDKNIFNKDIVKNLNIASIQESHLETLQFSVESLPDELKTKALYLIETFKNAKEIGSIIKVEENNYEDLLAYINKDITLETTILRQYIPGLVKESNILSRKYDVVVTNPPYMSDKSMSNEIKKYITKNYEQGKNDLFATFILVVMNMAKEDRYIGMITPFVWMFISSYEKLRNIFVNKAIDSMIQLEYNSFEVACVPVVTFVFKNINKEYVGKYIKLSNFPGFDIQERKVLEALNNENCDYLYKTKNTNFTKIPGNPIGYWLSEKVFEAFKIGTPLEKLGLPTNGMFTCDNNRFLRKWYEVENTNIYFDCTSEKDSINSDLKWYPYNKGGDFRKWYGNHFYVINFAHFGKEVSMFRKEKGQSASFPGQAKYFNESISWSLVSNYKFGARYYPKGFVFDIAGSSYFPTEKFKYILGYLTSNVAITLLNILNPTMNFQIGDVAKMPLIYDEHYENKVNELVDKCIELSENDWNDFETSWNFKRLNILDIKESNLVSKNIEKEIERKKELFNLEKRYEKELNDIFIEIYGLSQENSITNEILDRDVSVRIPTSERLVKDLMSYFVGCMFGRYSLDEKGIVYAGGKFDKEKYKTYKVDEDNIIPITDEAYFSDDIVERFKTFIKIVYGDNTFNENMDFIAEALGKKGTETSEETIRRYFVNDFFNDHIKMYQKRPIYWLLDSGKKNGFKALIYMHRYNENLIPKARLDYLHRVQTTYEKLLSDVNYRLTTELSMTDKKETKNRQTDLMAKLQEIKEYDEKIAHIANQRISIDLDDGVKVNYEKFKDILAKIK